MNDPYSNKNKNTDFSNGEMFVAVNLLSKIGVAFVIASVIAFSAASGGYIPDPARMGLVLSVGVIMLAAGEVFFRKNSRVYANALVYGGIAELFVCVPVGRHGMGVFDGTGALIMGFAAAAAGILLAVRYKSQGLVIVTELGSLLPVFCMSSVRTFLGLTVYLMCVECAAAVISRKRFYTAAAFSGIVLAVVKSALVWVFAVVFLHRGGGLTAAAFAACCGMCWSCGALLNSCENDGEIETGDLIAFLMSQVAVLFFVSLILTVHMNVRVAGSAMIALAMIYAVMAVCFGLRYDPRRKVVSMLICMALITAELSLFMLIGAPTPLYIALHSTAAAVFCAGVFLKRALFRNCGFMLLGIAEISFFAAMANADDRGLTGEKLLIIAVNLILWFGIMLVISRKEKKTGGAFCGYTFAVFLNAGILLCDLISIDIMRVISERLEFVSSYHRLAFSMLLCAVAWIAAGFALGKLKYLDNWRSPCSSMLYGMGLICVLWGNTLMSRGHFPYDQAGGISIALSIVVNILSVLAVLDAAVLIGERSAGFKRAIGLIVSGYALLTLTALLGINGFVNFTSCIISIIYIVMAAVWVAVGFAKSNSLLRRFGLALSLFSSAKLFLFDFRGVNAMGRTLLFIGFGITLLAISFGYAAAEKRLSGRKK